MTDRPSRTGIITIRILLLALTATLALVLIVHGNVLVGGLLGAIVITRAVLFASVYRRRAAFRSRR